MKITDPPHRTWISAVKKTGKIVSAYCTCVAGMSSSCIRVTALLFRIESANRNGLTNVACTSKVCEWNVPKEKTVVELMKISDMKWKASKLNKAPSRPICDAKRSLFNPVQRKQGQSENVKRCKLYLGLKDILPGYMLHGC